MSLGSDLSAAAAAAQGPLAPAVGTASSAAALPASHAHASDAVAWGQDGEDGAVGTRESGQLDQVSHLVCGRN